ncbi:MAG: FAD:protein FMN transferase [Myxococcota bacterium]
MTRRAALCAAALALACAAPAHEPAFDAPLVQITEGRPAMGTVLEITLVAADEATAHAAIERCFAEALRLEMIFTTWRDDGELARLNALAGRGAQRASPELVRILRDAQRLARDTGGAFDVSVAPLLALWREGERTQTLPSAQRIAAARARVGAARIGIDEARGTVALEAGTSLDLGGIAKGWALDRLGESLRAEGFERVLLDFGGSSLHARGSPLDARAWRVAAADGEILELGDADLSFSSSLGQSVEVAGERFGHIVDPRTGEPISRAVSVSVAAPNGAIAEGFSTALVVLGREGLTQELCAAGLRVRLEQDGHTYSTECAGDPK